MNYEPRPTNISGIVLSSELIDLTERLAANAHDLWAAERIKQGWTYGDQRDDTRKRTAYRASVIAEPWPTEGPARTRAEVAQPLAAMEMNWSLPWGKPLSK